MRLFSELFQQLDSTTSTLEKIDALKKYFKQAPELDAVWAVLILTGRIQKKSLTSRNLRDSFFKKTGYPDWLFEESYAHVGDTAETISLLLQSLELTSAEGLEKRPSKPLHVLMQDEIPALGRVKDDAARADKLMALWQELDADQIFILNKLITGGFRVGVSEKLVIRALSEVFGTASDQISHRLTGPQEASAENFRRWVSTETSELTVSQPYPFCLAYSWSDRRDQVWRPEDWALEWKYDGIRSQVIRRDEQVWIWSRGEEEISSTFPELTEDFRELEPGTVLDGEVVVLREGLVQPFQDLQKRLGRKKVSSATLKAQPAGFIAYDCLEYKGEDLRDKPFSERRRVLGQAMATVKSPRLQVSPLLSLPAGATIEDLEALRAQSRENRAEGLMLKAWSSPYVVGRKIGYWWKHKVDPLTLDAVLLYAQAGTGRRANLYTDYTFALWKEADGERLLVPFAKAYSGLDQAEIDELDAWIRRHTVEKFGPVRSLKPELVFELGFEGISKSNRHKSGIAVRFPRILRWRKDKTTADADSLETALQLLDAVSPAREDEALR